MCFLKYTVTTVDYNIIKFKKDRGNVGYTILYYTILVLGIVVHQRCRRKFNIKLSHKTNVFET
jgi:hypothetical protein